MDMKNYHFNQIWKDSSQLYDANDMHQKITISSKNKKIYKIVGNEILNQNNNLIKSGYLEILVSPFKSRNFKKFKIDLKEDDNNEIQIMHFQALDSTNELLVTYQKNNFDNKSIVFSTIKTPLVLPYEEKTNYAQLIILILVGPSPRFFVFVDVKIVHHRIYGYSCIFQS